MQLILLACLIICGTIFLIALLLFLRTRMSSATSDCSSETAKRHTGLGDCSPKRRNRRSRRRGQCQTTSLSSPARTQSHTTEASRRRVRLEDSEVLPDKNDDVLRTGGEDHQMEVDLDEHESEHSNSAVSKTKSNEQESKRKKGNELEIVSNTSSMKMDTSPDKPKDFSHPIYKQMSLKNGLINRMSKWELRSTLDELKCNSLGSGDVLKRRLKNHYSNESLKEAGLSTDVPVRYDYLCVIDVEATCLEYNPEDYIHEIIEFPIVLVNSRTLQIEDTFESFCKPVVNPKLSNFCSQLTHISQKMVDKATEFPSVLERAEAWMQSKGLGTKHSFAIVTDCSLDMDLYLKLQCIVSQIPFPKYAKEWINISKVFANLYKTKRVPLRAMLDSIGLEFSGQPHRGIDDARNIARIAIQLIEDGADLKFNEKLTPT